MGLAASAGEWYSRLKSKLRCHCGLVPSCSWRFGLTMLRPTCAQLVELFGRVRDEWIAADTASWLSHNAIYPGVADAVRAAMEKDEVYIVTTKQVRRGAACSGIRAWLTGRRVPSRACLQ